MSQKLYHGRLVCDGEGHLRADESQRVGERTIKIHDESGEVVTDENGADLVVTVPTFKFGKNHFKPVALDAEANGYVFIEEGDPSHNERHGRGGTPTITGTSGPLFDAEGNQVTPGDPHHLEPTPDDPHYDADAPRKTRLTWDADQPHLHNRGQVPFPTGDMDEEGRPIIEYRVEEGDPTTTGHTEAYSHG